MGLCLAMKGKTGEKRHFEFYSNYKVLCPSKLSRHKYLILSSYNFSEMGKVLLFLCFPEDDEQWRSIFLTVLKIGSRKKQKAGDNGGGSSSYCFFLARKQISCQSPGGNALGKNPIQD